MAFCGIGRSYKHLDENNREHSDANASDNNHGCFKGLKTGFGNFMTNCKNFLIDLGFPLEKEHIGKIISVRPICLEGQIPEGFKDGKCYHYIKLSDGSQFKMAFSNVQFDNVKDQLRVNRMVRITYKDPDYRVINVYPQRVYHTMDFDEFLEQYSGEIANDARVRICTIDDKVLKIEFINQGLFSDDENSTDNEVELNHGGFQDLDFS